jgi:hypothetical protein
MDNLIWQLLAHFLSLLARKNALALARKWARAVFAFVSIGLPREAKSRWRAEAMMDVEEDIWELMKDSRKSDADIAVHVIRRTLDLLWNAWGQRAVYSEMSGEPDARGEVSGEVPKEAVPLSRGPRRIVHVALQPYLVWQEIGARAPAAKSHLILLVCILLIPLVYLLGGVVFGFTFPQRDTIFAAACLAACELFGFVITILPALQQPPDGTESRIQRYRRRRP